MTPPRANKPSNDPIGSGLTGDSLAGGAAAHQARPPTLEEWQSHLQARFDALVRQREDSEWPVFALEHGLTQSERDALAAEVRKTVAISESLATAPLPWIVYAAEIGYQYSGEEYWRTFAKATPEWQDTQRDRDHVRHVFINFARRYHGAEPRGAWAEQFGIIAWPITHSILPRDLQRQLAELLYDARLSFREETFASAESLGRHLGALSGGSSARFRQFARDPALLGQIALALLLHDSVGAKAAPLSNAALIDPPTLERIIADLNRERDARDWLIEAGSTARSRIRGLSRIPFRLSEGERTDATRTSVSRAGDEDQLRVLLSRPRLLLREAAPNQWNVWVQFPNLAPVLGRIPHARGTLARVQGRIGGPSGPILASGRILSEAWPSARLSEWPATTGSLLQFDGAPRELQALLDSAFRLPPGDSWLFIIGADGQARELRTRVLRPGEAYVLLQRTKTANPAGGLVPAAIMCAGVYGLRIDVPLNVPEALSAVLDVLGLGIAQTLEVWPAGLPVPDWTGDGTVETLVGEPLVLSVRCDHALAALTVALDDNVAVRIPVESGAVGKPEFVILPSLSEGRHRLTMAATPSGLTSRHGERSPSAHTVETTTLTGSLDILVRPPRPTGDGGETGALSFAIHPRAPSLEDLWEDRCELHVSAPGARWIRCRVTLTEKGNSTPIEQIDLRLPTPIENASWRQAFRKQVRDIVGERCDEAHACILEFTAGPLGRARVVAERDFTPLRWIVRGGGGEAVLIDSRGEPGLRVVAYDCQKPAIAREVDPVAACAGLPIPATGTLLRAQSGTAIAAVVAVPPQRVTSFADLAQGSRIDALAKEPVELERLVELAATWENARLGANLLTALRRDGALRALHLQTIEMIAGDRWAAVEAAYHKHGNATRARSEMRSLVSTRPDQRGLAATLLLRVPELVDSSVAQRESFFVSAVSAFVQSERAPDMAAFALRLATSPAAAVAWAVLGIDASTDDRAPEYSQHPTDVPALRGLLEHLMSVPVVLRAARLMVVSIDAVMQGGSMHSRGAWNWT